MVHTPTKSKTKSPRCGLCWRVMGPDLFKGMGEALVVLMIVVAVAIPLALWKLIEIVIWLFNHVSVSWQ